MTLLRIGTRGSPLALAQAHETRDRLCAAHGFDPDDLEIVVIKTSGDRILDRPLSEVGGKGLFTKEIEEALLDGGIDLAVHSSKDMPTVLPEGLELSAFLPREDVRDAFLSPKARTLMDLPEGAVLGTSSLRRQALAKALRPDLEVVSFRGNVQSRMRKLEEGVVDATLLAYAGLRRLGMSEVATSLIAVEDFLPAVGQGAICIESRMDDELTRARLAPLHDAATASALICERAFLKVLDGSCRTPIAGHARIEAGQLLFDGLVARPDGSEMHRTQRRGAIEAAESLGIDAGEELAQHVGPGFFG